jgi:fermentation-respiration switch protein FrsA (DUF1100 family)
MIFLPDIAGRELVATPAEMGLVFREVFIQTSDNESLHAWWLPHPRARATLLFNHGNAGNLSHRLGSLRLFHDLGLNVLIYDYRGYGQSSGAPGEAGLYLDGEAALDWLQREAGIGPKDILVFGRSMGGAVAAYLAAEHSVAGLVLESSFKSVPDMAQDLYWWLPARWLARIRLDTRKFLADTQQPTLVIHSLDDEIVPFSHGQSLYATAPEPKRFLTIRGSHNTGFMDSEEVYTAALDTFIAQVLSR